VEVNKAFVHLEFKLVPSLRTFTARSLSSGNAEDLCGKADGAFHAEITVTTTSDKIARELFEIGNIAAGERDADFVGFGSRNLSSRSVVIFFALSNVTHFVFVRMIKWDSGDVYRTQ